MTCCRDTLQTQVRMVAKHCRNSFRLPIMCIALHPLHSIRGNKCRLSTDFILICKTFSRWRLSCFSLLSPLQGRRSGCTLIDSTQGAVVQLPQTVAKPKRKHSLLPTLIILFLVSYGLMCLLTVEQDRTIGAQRSLITSLLGDSTELSHLKVKIFQDQHPQQNAGTVPDAQEPSTQAPSAAPSTRTPMTQAPMTHDTPTGSSQGSHVAGKLRKSIPPKPPLGIADIVDGRRIANRI